MSHRRLLNGDGTDSLVSAGTPPAATTGEEGTATTPVGGDATAAPNRLSPRTSAPPTVAPGTISGTAITTVAPGGRTPAPTTKDGSTSVASDGDSTADGSSLPDYGDQEDAEEILRQKIAQNKTVHGVEDNRFRGMVVFCIMGGVAFIGIVVFAISYKIQKETESSEDDLDGIIRGRERVSDYDQPPPSFASAARPTHKYNPSGSTIDMASSRRAGGHEMAM